MAQEVSAKKRDEKSILDELRAKFGNTSYDIKDLRWM